jgi:hypothetical protein
MSEKPRQMSDPRPPLGYPRLADGPFDTMPVEAVVTFARLGGEDRNSTPIRMSLIGTQQKLFCSAKLDRYRSMTDMA